jgi:hypothetical protein
MPVPLPLPHLPQSAPVAAARTRRPTPPDAPPRLPATSAQCPFLLHRRPMSASPTRVMDLRASVAAGLAPPTVPSTPIGHRQGGTPLASAEERLGERG